MGKNKESKQDREAIISQIMKKLRRMDMQELNEELWHLDKY